MQRSPQGANTRCKKTMPQNTRRRNSNQQDVNMGPLNGLLGHLARTPMITEHQERFVPPQCYRTYVTTSGITDPYHPLRGTNADIGTLRSTYVVKKPHKIPPKPPQPSEPPKDYRKRASSVTRPARCTVVPSMPPKQDFLTVYQSDFQPWPENKVKPFRLKDNFNIKYGMVALDCPHEQKRRSAAVNSNGVPQEDSHPEQPRSNQVHPPQPAAASFQPKAASHINPELLGESSDFFDRFQSWSLETKFCGQPKQPGQPDDHLFVQMTHKSQGTKAVLPSVQTSKNSTEADHGNTMAEDFRVWSAPQVTTKPPSGCPKLNNAAGSSSSCDAKNKPPFPGENGVFAEFEHCTENEVTRMFWSRYLDTGKTGGGSCVEPDRSRHCSVSRGS